MGFKHPKSLSLFQNSRGPSIRGSVCLDLYLFRSCCPHTSQPLGPGLPPRPGPACPHVPARLPHASLLCSLPSATPPPCAPPLAPRPARSAAACPAPRARGGRRLRVTPLQRLSSLVPSAPLGAWWTAAPTEAGGCGRQQHGPEPRSPGGARTRLAQDSAPPAPAREARRSPGARLGEPRLRSARALPRRHPGRLPQALGRRRPQSHPHVVLPFCLCHSEAAPGVPRHFSPRSPQALPPSPQAAAVGQRVSSRQGHPRGSRGGSASASREVAGRDEARGRGTWRATRGRGLRWAGRWLGWGSG